MGADYGISSGGCGADAGFYLVELPGAGAEVGVEEAGEFLDPSVIGSVGGVVPIVGGSDLEGAVVARDDEFAFQNDGGIWR